MTLEVTNADKTDELFTHTLIGTVNITRLRQDILDGKVEVERTQSDLPHDHFAEVLETNYDIDVDKLRDWERRLKAGDADIISKLLEPIILLDLGDDKNPLLMDGAHRLAIMCKYRADQFRAYIVSKKALESYVVVIRYEGEVVSAQEILERMYGVYAGAKH